MSNVLSRLVFSVRKFFLTRRMKKNSEVAISKTHTPGTLEFAQEYLVEANRVLVEAITNTMDDYSNLASELLRAPEMKSSDFRTLADKFSVLKFEFVKSKKVFDGDTHLIEIYYSTISEYDDLIGRFINRAESIEALSRD